MEIRNHMVSPVRSVRPGDSIADAARVMERFDVGTLPVLEKDVLVGIVTDRDIVVRGLARGLDPKLPVSRVMTGKVITISHGACIDDALEQMATFAIRRLPVCGADGALLGIVSLGDLAAIDWDKDEVGAALGRIASRRPVPTRMPIPDEA